MWDFKNPVQPPPRATSAKAGVVPCRCNKGGCIWSMHSSVAETSRSSVATPLSRVWMASRAGHPFVRPDIFAVTEVKKIPQIYSGRVKSEHSVLSENLILHVSLVSAPEGNQSHSFSVVHLVSRCIDLCRWLRLTGLEHKESSNRHMGRN